jgi:predicted transcriptional regulator
MSEKQQKSQETLEAKWGKHTLAMGWTAFPLSLLFLQESLKITPVTMNVLMNLISYWWDAADSPFPAQESIAHRMGVSKRTVQRSMGELEKLKLIRRTKTERGDPRFRGRNLYDLAPLAEVLNEMTPKLKLDLELRKKQKEPRSDNM